MRAIFSSPSILLLHSRRQDFGESMSRLNGRAADRQRTLDVEGLLNNLQDWDALRAGDAASKGPIKILKEVMQTRGTAELSRKLSGSDSSNYLLPNEAAPTAASEKELGNEYFKKKDFPKAIEFYSRSIGLSPTSVAYANRAMCFIKLKRYGEAEADCTEALNLDDRYVKAYSRRATARKELGKFKLSLEDSGFALKLEPGNHELKKLHAETKALYDDEVSKKGIPGKPISVIDKGNATGSALTDRPQLTPTVGLPVHERKTAQKQGHMSPAHVLAARAASLATSAIPEKISPPSTAYQFEVSWRFLSSDSTKQANLLKSIPPPSLPQLFKNSLSAPMLFEIVKSISIFFKEETKLAVEILDYLTKVPRFDMIIMCLSSADKDGLRRIWDDVFSVDSVTREISLALAFLRRRYCIGPLEL